MKKTQKIALSTLASTGGLLSSLSVAHAAITNPVLDSGPFQSNAEEAVSGVSFAQYFIHLWRGMLAIGAILVILYFIWGAVEWITSAGEKGKLENARNRITQAILGLVILVGSFALIGFLGQLLFGGSFDILKITFPSALQ